MNAFPMGALVAVVAVLLSLAAALGVVLARARSDMTTSFAACGFFAGVATAASGEALAGAACCAASATLGILAEVAGARSGAMRLRMNRPWIGAGMTAALVLLCLAAWPTAPSFRGAPTRHDTTPAFATESADALFAAMALLLGVAGVATTILGRGERGVFGADRNDTP